MVVLLQAVVVVALVLIVVMVSAKAQIAMVFMNNVMDLTEWLLVK